MHPPKSDEKNSQEMFNWSEVRSEKNTTYKIHTFTVFLAVILNFAYFFKAIVRINLQPATPVNDAQFLREYEFVLAANSSNPEQDSSGDNQMQIRIPLSVTADWKVTGKSEPAILEYNITEPRYFFSCKNPTLFET